MENSVETAKHTCVFCGGSSGRTIARTEGASSGTRYHTECATVACGTEDWNSVEFDRAVQARALQTTPQVGETWETSLTGEYKGRPIVVRRVDGQRVYFNSLVNGGGTEDSCLSDLFKRRLLKVGETTTKTAPYIETHSREIDSVFALTDITNKKAIKDRLASLSTSDHPLDRLAASRIRRNIEQSAKPVTTKRAAWDWDPNAGSESELRCTF